MDIQLLGLINKTEDVKDHYESKNELNHMLIINDMNEFLKNFLHHE